MKYRRVAGLRMPSVLFVFAVVTLLLAPASSWAQAGPDPDTAAFSEGVRLRNAGQYEAAAAVFQKLATKFPYSSGAQYQLGLTRLISGEPEQAVPHLEAATKAARLRPHALYNLACAQARLRKTDEAIDVLGRAIDAGFGDVATARKDSDLESIRSDRRFTSILERAGRPWNERLQFWVGEWDCYSAQSGKLNGRNTLASRQNGSVIHEAWRGEGPNGGVGESWNCYDRSRGVWRQVWVGAAGDVTDFVGTPQGKGVLFEARRTDGFGREERIRMFVRPIAGERVQQTGTRSLDNGATWQPRYDLVYVPKGEAFARGESNS